MAGRKVEIPAVEELPIGQDGAETTSQIAKRLKVSREKALEIIHRYAELGQLRTARVPGLNVAGVPCKHIVYWLEEK